jgi:hypothetical protein
MLEKKARLFGTQDEGSQGSLQLVPKFTAEWLKVLIRSLSRDPGLKSRPKNSL